MNFSVNKVFTSVFHTIKRMIDVWGGRGRGGSHFVTDYALFLITQPKYFRGYFIRQVFADIRDSLFRDFKDRIDENQSLNINDFHIDNGTLRITYLPTGNTIISKGVAKDGSRTAKMKSLAGATHVFIEEADELGESDFDQLDLSLRTIKSEKIQIIRCFNPPPKRHWIWRDYNLSDIEIMIDGKAHIFCSAVPKSDANILSIHSTYHDNIGNLQPSTIEKFEAFKATNPEYYYTQVMGLISEGAKGRIYSGWLHITDSEYKALDLPKVYCLDFGYSGDPNALLEVKYEKDYRYFRELLYESGLDNIALAKRLRDLGVTSKDIVMADPGAGGDLRIAELRRGFTGVSGYDDLRFNIHPTVKGSGSINVGITKVKSCVNYMTEGSTNGWNEYANYKWALDADKNPTDTPIDKDNHLMDSRRYFELNKGRLY
jgi:phage terminase large subunit